MTYKQKYANIYNQERGELGMNYLKGEINNPNGSIDIVIIESNNTKSPLNKMNKYKLANYSQKKENKVINTFKNSIIGTEIGIKAEGFTNIAILATILAVGIFCAMYVIFRI